MISGPVSENERKWVSLPEFGRFHRPRSQHVRRGHRLPDRWRRRWSALLHSRVPRWWIAGQYVLQNDEFSVNMTLKWRITKITNYEQYHFANDELWVSMTLELWIAGQCDLKQRVTGQYEIQMMVYGTVWPWNHGWRVSMTFKLRIACQYDPKVTNNGLVGPSNVDL